MIGISECPAAADCNKPGIAIFGKDHASLFIGTSKLYGSKHTKAKPPSEIQMAALDRKNLISTLDRTYTRTDELGPLWGGESGNLTSRISRPERSNSNCL